MYRKRPFIGQYFGTSLGRLFVYKTTFLRYRATMVCSLNLFNISYWIFKKQTYIAKPVCPDLVSAPLPIWGTSQDNQKTTRPLVLLLQLIFTGAEVPMEARGFPRSYCSRRTELRSGDCQTYKNTHVQAQPAPVSVTALNRQTGQTKY